jgi:threonine efflux protein
MRDRRAGLWTAVGVSTGDLVWATTALVGVGALLEHSRPVFSGLKWLGAMYLLVLAIRLWRDSGETAPASILPRGGRRSFLNGVLVDLANPKAAVFFTSLYASLVPSDLDLWTAGSVLTITIVIVFGWYTLLALLLSRSPAQRAYRRARRGITRASAGVMAVLGARLALSD